MYSINDIVMYGKIGACKISDITVPNDSNFNKNQEYYVMKPLHENCKIYTPVNTTVFMRPAISAEEADRLIDKIPSIHAEAFFSDCSQDLERHYESTLQHHSCEDLIKLTMSLHAKKQVVDKQHQKFGPIDQKFMKRAEELLFGELSLAIGIPEERVPEYIASRVEGSGQALA